MRWITIPLLLATVAWTALSFLAYSDWGFAFKISSPTWLACAAVWAVIRLRFAGSAKRSGTPQKTKMAHRNRHFAGLAVTTSLVIFVFAVFGVKWLEKGNESRREVLSLARNTANERILGNESARADALLQNKDELWSVQVGAFRSEQDAVKLATSLKIKGYEAHVIRGELNAVNLYRAKVGRFGTREEAERLLRVLKDKEAYRTAFVVRL